MIDSALRLIRTHHDLKASDLCVKLGISKGYLYNLENGSSIPDMKVLKKYAQFFKIRVSTIMLISDLLNDENYNGELTAAIRQKMIVHINTGNRLFN